jgi:hypothetical protein
MAIQIEGRITGSSVAVEVDLESGLVLLRCTEPGEGADPTAICTMVELHPPEALALAGAMQRLAEPLVGARGGVPAKLPLDPDADASR